MTAPVAHTSRVNLPELKGRARSACREGVAAVVRSLPSGPIEHLRTSFPTTNPASVRHHIDRRLLEVLRHRGIPAPLEFFPLLDHPDILLTKADSFVAERAYWFGEAYGYEPGGIMWWRHFCHGARNILELGANIGYYTVQGAVVAPDAHYLAVEPHPGCAQICRRNLEINHLQNVEVLEAAAVPFASSSTVTLMLPGGHDHYYEAPSTGFVGRNEVHHDDATDPSYLSVNVPSVELRSLIKDVDLFKLDVEGQEYDLLSSIGNELRTFRPTIFLEVLDDTPQLRSLVLKLCSDAGYRSYLPTAADLVPIPPSELKTMTVKSRSGGRDIVLTCHPLT